MLCSIRTLCEILFKVFRLGIAAVFTVQFAHLADFSAMQIVDSSDTWRIRE